jgi:adenylylsulfate reductase subunit B
VKICPQNAIEVRHYADVVPLGASVQPLRGSDSIMWTIKFRNGKMKRFKFPIRTTPEGSIEPYAGKPQVNMDDLDKPGLFTMSNELKGDRSQLIRL